ncbi:hypothetical protein GALMADRAFT_1244154 [Galerina marginata CBS 339.88]|uniref:Uncharacterized protein n=1 Tax=Galerina marginata (strain CBS 339.88) TaxID=685588 RepID=A0A067TKQ1_GALM3|nr:hypothetical protein GALMADRAFT_1244154 [Galerina marginata CBS 339.88]
MGASVLLDDSKVLDIIYSGTQWTHQTNVDSLFNRTLTVCATNTRTTPAPSFSFLFYGTDISIYAPGKNGVAFNYTIDGTTIRPGIINSFPNVKSQTSVNIWNLQGLDSAVYHSLKVFPTAGQFAIDYLTYTPNQNTGSFGLVGLDLIVDDADGPIQYSGSWTNSTSSNVPAGIPYKGTLTGTKTNGSSMNFAFTGSTISVYGLLNQGDGKLSASFSVDGGAPTAFAPFNGTQTIDASLWTPSQFFHQDLVPGSHSLHVELGEATGSQMLWIDSVIFEATTGSSTNTSTSNSTHSKFPLGAIGGIVAGLLVLLVLGRVFRRKPVIIPVTVVEPEPEPMFAVTRITQETTYIRR